MTGSIGHMLATAAARFGDAAALVVDGRTWSYRALDDHSSRCAAGLAEQGIRPGAVVSLYASNSAEWIIAYHAILKAGCVVNPLNLMLTPSEALFAMEDCAAVAVMGTADKIAPLAKGQGPGIRIVWGGDAPDDAIAFDDLLSGSIQNWQIAEVDAHAISTIAYTSGTTGHPKGAQLSHQAIQLNVMMTATMHLRGPQDVVATALPLSHVYGNVVMNAAILCGSKLILDSIFDAERMLANIAEHEVTVFDGVPTMYMYMLAVPELGRFKLTSLTRCTVGGQTMPLAKMKEVEAAFGCPLIELWGMTELGGLGTTHSALGPAKLGSIGVALPFLEARIASAEAPDTLVDSGEVGELQIRGPMVMDGYFNRPEANADTLLPGGWLRTGDLVSRDADGHFFVVDRLKDMIITGGFNIYPAELERAISEHPDVVMAAATGIGDDTKGELAHAFIVTRPGASIDAASITAHCRARLAAYKVPRAFHFVKELPRTSSGKILRRNLHQLLE